MKNVGIYIHFPFCTSKCKYCNFNSYSGKDDKQLDYFQALLQEINLRKDKKIIVDTIFIGGGTPSTMFDGCISTLLSEIRKAYTVDIDAEITIECNPNSVTLKKAREWKDAGINRVSIGLQSASDKLLKLIGRIHTKKDYIEAIKNIEDAGITNINTDCLVGLPKQKLSDVKYTLKLVNKLKCTHVSVYSLILEKDTPLYEMVENNQVALPKEEKTLSMYNFALKYLKENGYYRYEVSNFAKKGCECKHNLHTWQMHEYLGFGAGAHGYIDGHRYANYSDIDKYIESVNSKKSATETDEKITNSEELEETLMLGLRTKFGVDLDLIKKKFKVDLLKTKHEVINTLLSNGFISLVYNKLIPTDLGFTVLNQIILDLVS